MRLIVKVLLCLCFVPVSLFAQERITKVAVGPHNDQFRIVVAFIEASEEKFKMQSMIIDMAPIKNNQEQPSAVFVDLTTTVRTLSSGEKKQNILQLRWKKSGELELKCEGKWVKKESNSGTDKIIEAVKSVIKNVPLNTKPGAETTLPAEVEQKAAAVLDSLNTENQSCLRVLN